MRRWIAFLTVAAVLCGSMCGAYAAPEVSAKSAILIDADSGRVLYEKDAHIKRPIASTTKLMTALVAVESTPDLDRVFTMEWKYQAEGSSMYLKLGEQITLRELLYGLLLASGNDAALVIAGGCGGTVEEFVEWMNLRAADLGMTNTHFANPNGLDDPEHYSTAYDMSLLGQAVLGNETLRDIIATRSATVAGRELTNHNKLLWRYEGCIGMKTGYTDTAGRTLVSCAQREGQTLICVTLHAPSDWDDHARLLDYGFSVCPTHLLARKGKRFRRLAVEGGVIPQVEVETASDVSYPLTKDEPVTVQVVLPKTVQAPVSKGAIAGQLIFHVGETTVGECYLVYSADIPANAAVPTLFQRFWDLLFGRNAWVSTGILQERS